MGSTKTDRLTFEPTTACTRAMIATMLSGKAQNGKTYLDPQGNATRAEVAAIMMSFITKVLGE